MIGVSGPFAARLQLLNNREETTIHPSDQTRGENEGVCTGEGGG